MASILEMVARLDELDEEDVLFSKPEWGRDSECAIFRLDDEGRVPAKALEQGFKYMLGVSDAREVLEDFAGRREVTVEEKCDRIIQYALYDY
jgi:hypothetical protein